MSNYYGMNFDRYDFLMDSEGPCVKLNEEELKQGWHFCDEWDGLLIHPDSPEFAVCTCPHMETFRTQERKEYHQNMKEQRQETLNKLAELDEELGLYEINIDTPIKENLPPPREMGWGKGKDE